MCFGVMINYPPYLYMDRSLAVSTGSPVVISWKADVLTPYWASKIDIRGSHPTFLGTVCTGIMYCMGPIVTPLMERIPRFATWAPKIGAAMCAGSLFLSSYATKVGLMRASSAWWELLLLDSFFLRASFWRIEVHECCSFSRKSGLATFFAPGNCVCARCL